MCFGTGGYRTFPNSSPLGVEDNPSVRLQPSLSAPVSDAGVKALATPPPKPPVSFPSLPPVGLPGGGGGRGGSVGLNPRLYMS